jgi:hypothetical protein
MPGRNHGIYVLLALPNPISLNGRTPPRMDGTRPAGLIEGQIGMSSSEGWYGKSGW